jgi:signal transduction histidine kinase
MRSLFIKWLSFLRPKTMAGEMIAILFISLGLFLVINATLEYRQQQSTSDQQQHQWNLNNIKTWIPIFEVLNENQASKVTQLTSSCHAGHNLTQTPYPTASTSTETAALTQYLSQGLNLPLERILVGHQIFSQQDFSYQACNNPEIAFPFKGIVISIKLASGYWLNSEIHPHQSHLIQNIFDRTKRALLVFLFIGGVAVYLISHLNKPLNNLSKASREFAQGLNISAVKESGPLDIQSAIRSFNTMQQQVTQEVTRRSQTLAAISHDIRTPLTALRIKAELVEHEQDRNSLISSITKMEKITASALEFLKGESRTEPMRLIDLNALLETECLDFIDAGQDVSYTPVAKVMQVCRPDALARAFRNLIENAVKYGGSAIIKLSVSPNFITISISDNGPGIPENQLALVVEPFKRLSKARESDKGGFGLGLAIVKAITSGHNAQLILSANKPTGLVAAIRLNRALN